MNGTFQRFCLEVGKGRSWSEDVVEKEDGSHEREKLCRVSAWQISEKSHLYTLTERELIERRSRVKFCRVIIESACRESL